MMEREYSSITPKLSWPIILFFIQNKRTGLKVIYGSPRTIFTYPLYCLMYQIV